MHVIAATLGAELVGILVGWLIFKLASRWWPAFGAVIAMAQQITQMSRQAMPVIHIPRPGLA